MKYRVLAYNGTAWLSDLGTFDTFDEAQDALTDECDRMIDDCTDDEITAWNESFYFNSRIEEVY